MLGMRVRWVAIALAQLVGPPVAGAQALRCAGTLVSAGDSKLGLLRACGPPAASAQFCTWSKPPTPPYVPAHGALRPPEPICIPVEELLYERDPGDLPAMVRIRDGRIVAIRFGSARWERP